MERITPKTSQPIWKTMFSITMLIFILALNTQAQKETNWWYFGNQAGLNFNKITNGLPEVLDNGAMFAYEANATISDRNGNLLFYTDGRFVFDANHDTMPNGRGLLGNMSCTQAAIVPNPGNAHKFYIFHNDYHAFINSVGFSYSEVDMSLRGGLGDVINASKNTNLADTIAERIAAVKMKGRKGYWVVVHKYLENKRPSNVYYSYEVTVAGVNPVPVVSRLGPLPTGVADFAGSFKFSGCGDKLATVFESSTVLLMDFNPATGQLSNARSERIPSTSRARTYGIEFSEDGSLLYVGFGVRNDKSQTKIRQYSTNVTSSAALSLSAIDLTDPMLESIRGMQRGPDGKIYFIYGNANVLGIIHDPNERGTLCNLDPNGLSLIGKGTVTNSLGLPSFLCSYFCPDPNIETRKYCFGHPTIVELTGNLEQADSILFNYGDPASGDNLSKLPLDSHLYSNIGEFDIYAIIYYTNSGVVERDTMYKTIEIINLPDDFLGPDTAICQGDTLHFEGSSTASIQIWDEAMNSVTSASNPGQFFGRMELEGCVSKDTISVDTLPLPRVDLGPDTLICSAEFYLSPRYTDSSYSYEWEDGWTFAERMISSPGEYYLTARGPCGITKDSITVNNFCECEVELPNVFTPNDDGYNDVFKAVKTCETKFFRFTVYNRWGNKIHESTNREPEWDGQFNGKTCAGGVYFWELEYEQAHQGAKSLHGHTLLIRE